MQNVLKVYRPNPLSVMSELQAATKHKQRLQIKRSIVQSVTQLTFRCYHKLQSAILLIVQNESDF